MPRTAPPPAAPVEPLVPASPGRIRRERRRLFSDRERQVFQLLRDGLPPDQICARLGVNRRAVRFAQTQLRNKLGCVDVAELRELASQAHTETATAKLAPR